MPDDNSCLFRAFSYAITPPDLPNDQPSPHDLRSLVQTIILADPETYNSAILEGKEPATYCAEMMSPDKWGGAIELGILSKHFDVRVDTIDVESGAVLSFHEAAPTRAILIYSGIHYDTVAQTPFRDAPGEVDRRLWEVGDGVVLARARELCGILRAQSYFTNTENFGLVCTAGGCGWVGQGWKEAGAHSKRTGHGGFDQIQ
jgi:ubiquitin thioesterase OTU1